MGLQLASIRYLIALLCFALPFRHAYGQRLEGLVSDRHTGEAIQGASIMLGGLRTTAGADGRFSIPLPAIFPTTVTVTHVSYDPTSVTLANPTDTLLLIHLVSTTIGLEEVAVLGRRDPQQDSIKMREEFADQFNFKPVKPWQALGISPVGLAINLNVLFASLSREQKQSKRLKAALIRDEREDYVDRRFTKTLIQTQSGLSGEELDIFHWYFRPSYEQLLDFTEYDLLVYIRSKCHHFSTRRDEYPTGIPLLHKNP